MDTVSDMVPKSLNDQRDSFRAVAAAYRRHTAFVFVFGLTGILAVLGTVMYSNKSEWFIASFVLCLLGALIASFSSPRLRCPACSQDAGGMLRTYCPECGSPSLEGSVLSRRCGACGKTLWRGKGRSYQIHYCTNCGAYLAEKGL